MACKAYHISFWNARFFFGSTNASKLSALTFQIKNASMSTFLLHDITNLIYMHTSALLLSIRFLLMVSLRSMTLMRQKLTLNQTVNVPYTLHLAKLISYRNIVPIANTRWSLLFVNPLSLMTQLITTWGLNKLGKCVHSCLFIILIHQQQWYLTGEFK
jgi:hypothetical protein